MERVNSTKYTRQLRVLFPRQFPAVSTSCSKFPPVLIPTKNCEFPGLFVELIANHIHAELVVKTLNATSEENSSGLVEKNRTTGFLAYVMDDTVDTLAYPLQRTATRELFFDFSDILYYLEYNILHRKHDKSKLGTLWAFFTIYDGVSSSTIIAILILQATFYIALQYCQDSVRITTFNEITDGIWEAMQLYLGRTIPISRRFFSVKFNVMTTHFLHYIILLGVYSSWLFSQKVISNKAAHLEGLPEIIKELESGQKYLASTTGQDWFFQNVKDSDVYPYKDIREALKGNPAIITNMNSRTLTLASTGDAMIFVMEDDELNAIAQSYCNLAMKESITRSTAHLVFKKGNPLIELVNWAVRNNTVEIIKIKRKYFNYIKSLRSINCGKRKVRTNNRVVLPYYGLMIAWAGCIAFSTICFMVEYSLIFCFRQWRRFKKNAVRIIFKTESE